MEPEIILSLDCQAIVVEYFGEFVVSIVVKKILRTQREYN